MDEMLIKHLILEYRFSSIETLLKEAILLLYEMAEKDVIITFDTIFDLSRREKFRQEIQKVDAKFFDDVVRYFIDKQAIIEAQEKKKSVFAAAELDKTKAQLREAKLKINEIYTWRETKIVNAAIFQSRCTGKGLDMSALLPEELELFNSVQGMLSEYRDKILHQILNHEMPKICCRSNGNGNSAENAPEEESEAEQPKAVATEDTCLSPVSLPKALKTTSDTTDGSCRISVKSRLPEFMGPDMNKYGPFNPGDNAEIPKEIAAMLVQSGNAVME